MTARAFLRQLARESRGARGRLAFFALCLAVGVAGVTAVAGFSAALRDGLRSEARKLLAADLRVEGRRPLSPEAAALLAGRPELRVTRLREMPTVVAAPGADGAPGRSQVVELRAVDGEFPFYGELALEPARPLAELLADRGAVAGRELFARLGLAVGDPLTVGGERFTLRGIVRREPDRVGGAFALGPRLFVADAELEATGLLARGSRVEHSTLVALPAGSSPAQVEELAAALRTALAEPAFYRVETFVEGQPELRRGVDRSERFLGLAALLSLVVGGIGIAQTVRAWLASRLDSIAVLAALGARPREIAALFLAQIGLLALTGSAVGAALGVALQRALPSLVASFLPDLPAPAFQPGAIGRGLALGAGISLLFALGPLVAALRVPALRVLRRDAEPIPVPRWAALGLGALLVAGTAAIAAAQAKSLATGALFAAGLAATTAVLALAARALVALAARLPRLRLPTALRWSVAALARPGAGTLGSVVALGLGGLVLVGMASVEQNLQRRFAAELPRDAPTAFLIDIQPTQWQGVRETIAAAGATRIDSVPLVMARLATIDGERVADLAEADRRQGRRRWALTREQRLTWLERLPADNELVAGALWSDPQAAEVSVEEEFARELGLAVGTRLVFDVQGVEVALTVTSLRRVRWESFAINFFWVVEPGVLDDAPQLRIAAVRLSGGGEESLRDTLAARYPNVTLFAIREVLDRVVAVLEKIGSGVRFLGLFTLVAAAAILAGAVAATAARRAHEVAIGKVLGMTRGQVVVLFASEYALSGLAGGAVGAVAGCVMAWAVARWGFEIPWRFDAALVVGATLGTALLAAAAGLAASARALAERPIEALRHEL
ncbi:MAG TPA: FtsX-like permease family protein [Thermoanaerobaculia bacterium]